VKSFVLPMTREIFVAPACYRCWDVWVVVVTDSDLFIVVHGIKAHVSRPR